MRFSTLFIFFFLLSCNSLKYNDKKKETFSGKGFAYIYNQKDYEKKIIKSKIDNEEIFVGHNFLKPRTSLILINPDNKKKINTQVSKKIEYPDFYKILITKKIANFLELDEKAPFIEIVEMLKNAGAKEIHMRIASPPVKFPCYYGIDTPSESELLASKYSIKEIASYIGVDSLKFITLNGVYNALGFPSGRDPNNPQFTDHYFSGDYPVRLVDKNIGKKPSQLSLLIETK